MKKSSFLLFAILLGCNCLLSLSSQAQSEAAISLPSGSDQLLLVTTDSWDATSGRLQRYEKKSGKWKPVGSEISVMVGRSGLAWGLGLDATTGDGPTKQEGDGKAPAGIFKLGPVFGYEAAAPAGSDMPYQSCTLRDYFVDDVNSPDYNQWVSIPLAAANDPKEHWKSFEQMRRNDHQYKWGVVVQHNMSPVVPGKGSAIFLHIWNNPGSPTSGCTAMQEADLVAIIQWLNPKKSPVLVQLTQSELGRLVWK